MGKVSINRERIKYINNSLVLGKSYTCNSKKIEKVDLKAGSVLLNFEDKTQIPVTLGDLKKLHQNQKIELED